MRATNKDNNSALKRLIPAVAMLALSAVTLSTSTYAWFTMNKTVDLTGINMAATASGGIEIALASVKDNSITFPDSVDDEESETGWKSIVVAGNYYEKIGPLKPVSSADGKTLYDAIDASNGGKSATKFTQIALDTDDTAENEKKMAKIVQRSTFSSNSETISSDTNEGYYVDIPVHLRTSKVKSDGKEDESIYYKMVINNNESSENSTSTQTKELYKAVRIAFIDGNGNAHAISGADNTYHNNGGPIESVDNDKIGTRATTVNINKDDVVYSSFTDAGYDTSEGADTGLKIKYAESSGAYGHLDFKVRVWLEGESALCYDKNSGQSWNIGFTFFLKENTN